MAAEEWAVELVRDELRRARDLGEGREHGKLREAVGLGAGDFDAALNVLRENGEVANEFPGTWRFVEDGEREESTPAPEREPDDDLPPDEPADEGEGSIEGVLTPEAVQRMAEKVVAGREGASASGCAMVKPRPVADAAFGSTGAQVVLTRAIVDALDDETLGAMVSAGVGGVEGEFVIRVIA